MSISGKTAQSTISKLKVFERIVSKLKRNVVQRNTLGSSVRANVKKIIMLRDAEYARARVVVDFVVSLRARALSHVKSDFNQSLTDW